MKTNDAIKITNEYVCMQYYTKKNQKEKIINVLKMIFLHQFDRKNIYVSKFHPFSFFEKPEIFTYQEKRR